MKKLMAERESTGEPAHRRRDVCDHCQHTKMCEPRADLHTLVVSREILQAEYGWDVFGFIAEARQQCRKAQTYGCPDLPAVRQEATALAPEEDFSNVD